MNNICCLDTMLNRPEEYLKNKKIINKLDIRSLMLVYKNKLEASNQDAILPNSNDFQYYEREILLLNNDYYKLYWSIEKAKEIIAQNKMPNFVMPLAAALPTVDTSNILQSKLPYALNNNEPAIMVYIPFLGSATFLIDGNHRVISRHLANRGFIRSYVLPPEYHMEALLNDYFRNIFAINYNFWLVTNYILGFIDEKEMNVSMLRLR